MGEIKIGNTSEMSGFLASGEAGRIVVPFEANLLLTSQEEPKSYLAELEGLAAEAGRSVHLH